MSVEAYINPDFGPAEKLVFLLAAFTGVVICLALILGGVAISVQSFSREERTGAFYLRAHNRIQQFYEMMIAGTSVMSFSCAYVITNHIYAKVLDGATVSDETFSFFIHSWENGRDFILLLLICLSCVLNTILDRFLIPLKHLSREEKASIRMLAMFYVIIVLVYLNRIGDESEYNPVMMYYLGLMVGRFVYFDASFSDFIDALKNLFRNLSLLVLGLALTGILCYFGFDSGYLLERNYYIVGIFYTNLFLLLVIFVIYHTHVLDLLIKKPVDNS